MFMRYSGLKPILDRYRQSFQPKRIPLYPCRKRFGQSRIPIGARIEVSEFTTASYHEKKTSDSGAFIILARQKPGPECGVSDQDAVVVDSLYHDELPVAVVTAQRDGRTCPLRQVI